MNSHKLYLIILIIIQISIPTGLSAQFVFSRFDFNQAPLTQASIGPDGVSLDPDAVTDGVGAYINNNCASPKGIDLVIDNSSAIFDQPSLGMRFRFQRDEAFATFFERGATRFYIQGGLLFVQYETTRPNGSGRINGPYATGFLLPGDDEYREFTFSYVASTGVATVEVNGAAIWTMDGPDGRDLYWTNTPDPIVGTIMDGNCMGKGILDFAEFFVPAGATLLPVEFSNFTIENITPGIQLTWEVTQPDPQDRYIVERSQIEGQFSALTEITGGTSTFSFTDQSAPEGDLWYRIRGIDADGISTYSQALYIRKELKPAMQLNVGPNPAHDQLNIDCQNCEGSTIKLLNLQGEVMQSANITLDRTTLNWYVDALPRGLYLLRIEGNIRARSSSKKIWVN